MMTISHVILASILAATLAASALAQPASFSFGVLNQQSPALTAERWNPILHYVSSVSGVTLKLKMGATVEETDAMMGRGEFDFVFTNHNFQSEFDAVGYKVIARWAGDPIRCVIAVPADSQTQNLRQLEGRRVAFPSPDAFVGYAVPMVEFKKSGVRVEVVFSGNQEGALAQLKARRVDAAAVNSRFLAQYAEREGVHFREIFASEPYPDLAVIAHPRLAVTVVDKVRLALIGMKNDSRAMPVLERAKSKGFERATDRDYDSVRRVYRLIGQ